MRRRNKCSNYLQLIPSLNKLFLSNYIVANNNACTQDGKRTTVKLVSCFTWIVASPPLKSFGTKSFVGNLLHLPMLYIIHTLKRKTCKVYSHYIYEKCIQGYTISLGRKANKNHRWFHHTLKRKLKEEKIKKLL